MSSINIHLHRLNGYEWCIELPSDFTLADLKNSIRALSINVENCRFVVPGHTLDLNDEFSWTEQRKWITNNTKILVCSQLRGGCFLADTLVMRADKGVIPISTIQVGDQLLSFANNGEIVTTTVQETFVRNVDDYIELKVGEDKTLLVTSDHWMYVGKESFAQLGNLRINDSLFVLSMNNDLLQQ